MNAIGYIREGFRKPSAPEIATLLQRIAKAEGLTIPDGFRFLSYVQGKCGVEGLANNIRAAIDQLPDVLRRYKGKASVKAA